MTRKSETAGSKQTKHIFAESQRITSKMVSGTAGAYEGEQYYFHPDHLGSSSFITDTAGDVYEYLEYFPYGETWGHQQSGSTSTPYKFTGKELDEETGLYYYGARYYDPRTSVWVSADPILASYMNGQANGGVFNPKNLMLFSYTMNNPVVLVDPNGMWTDNGDGSFNAEKGDTLSGLSQETGRDWTTSNFNGDPTKLQVGQDVSFDKGNNSSALTIDSTADAVMHYYTGDGPAQLGTNTINKLKNSSDQKYREGRIRSGKTSSLHGNYAVDMESEMFHVGSTVVKYATTCGTKSCVTNFSGFENDGMWDVSDVFNLFNEGGVMDKMDPFDIIPLNDGLGPNSEDLLGDPYPYVPHNWSISFPTPYK